MDLVLPQVPTVSREHARFTFTDGRWWVANLGRNGLSAVPPQVASLRGLKKLSLDYNALRAIPSFVGELPNLEELSLNANGGVTLPPSLAKLKANGTVEKILDKWGLKAQGT